MSPFTIADVRAFTDVALWTEVCVGAQDGVVGDVCAVKDAAVADKNPAAEVRVLNDGVGTNAAVRADGGGAEELYIGLNDGVCGDFNGGVNDAGIRPEDADTLGHKAAGAGETHGLVKVHHLCDGVGSENLINACGLNGDDAFSGGDKHGGDVCEVELRVGVVGGEMV